MTLYLSRDLRSIELPWLPRSQAPLIIHAVLAGESRARPVYLLTPLLYAALELQTDALDAAYLAGRLSREAIDKAVERLACVVAWANQWLDWSAVGKARIGLAGQGGAAKAMSNWQPMAWVVDRYIERMGGRAAVAELERLANTDPFLWDEGMVAQAAVADGKRRAGNSVADGKRRAGNSVADEVAA